MKKIYLLLLLNILTVTAQEFTWVQTPGITLDISSQGIAYCVAADNAGNSYFAGYKDTPFPYTETFGNLYYNKYGTGGELVFSKTFTGRGYVYNLKTDLEGNVIMLMGYVNTITIGDLALSTVNQGVQALLIKFDPSGNIVWHQHLSVPEADIQGFEAITIDADNNIYIGVDSYFNSYIRKLSPEGAILLEIPQLNVNRITSVSVDDNGNIYGAGSCANSNSSYAGVSMPTDLAYSIYAVKYSANGEFQWLKYLEDITCPNPIIKAATPNDIYFSSTLFGPYSFDNITTEGPISGFSDAFVAKLNGTGNFQWVREVPGLGGIDIGSRIFLETDAQANVYLAGKNYGTTNWQNGLQTSVTGSSGSDAFLIEYNPAGNIVMVKTAGGVSQDRFDSVAVNASGNVFVTGMVNGSANFGPFTTVPPVSGYYPFIAKIGTTLDIDDHAIKNVSIYPNPANDKLYISGIETAEKVSVINVLGQSVFDVITAGYIDTSNLSAGIYFLRLEGSKPLRFIKK